MYSSKHPKLYDNVNPNDRSYDINMSNSRIDPNSTLGKS